MTTSQNVWVLDNLVLTSCPARADVSHDGWLVRTTPNDVKRARSVTAQKAPSGPLDEQIEWCERLYLEKGLPPLFRISAATQPSGLDEELALRGYAVIEPTLVQTLNLHDIRPVSQVEWTVEAVAPHLWVNAVGNFRRSTLLERQSHLWRLNVLGDAICLAGAFYDGSIVGTGSVVIEDGYAGILDMHTREDYRGRGVATALLNALLAYAGSREARTAWLGVLEDNEPARRLYAKFGFETASRYWYRIKTE